MDFENSKNENIVNIDNINDLKDKKLHASDLQNIYIDKNGDQFRLKFNPKTKKVRIVKIISDSMEEELIEDQIKKGDDGTDNGSNDDQQITENLQKSGQQEKKPAAIEPEPLPSSDETIPEERETEPIKSSDDIDINSMDNVWEVIRKTTDRLDIVIRNISDSNIYDERFNFDDKKEMEDLRSLVKTNIINEFQTLKERYEDIFRGFANSTLKQRIDDSEYQDVLQDIPETDQMTFLRELHGIEIYKTQIEEVLNAFSEIKKRSTLITDERLSQKKYHERQRYNDAIFILETCKKDVELIRKYINQAYNQKINK